MGTSLTGLTPATTYDALIKVGDNGPLSATAKVLSDGLGNDSVLALSTARVGVGTTSPSYPLGIVGDTALEGNENYLYFHSTYSIGNNARARMRSVGAGGGSGYGGDFRIDTRASNNTWNADAFTINSAGNVGIGTSTPAALLHLEKPSQDNVLAVVGQDGFEGALFLSAAGSGKDANITIGNSRSLIFYSTANSTPAARGTKILTIDSQGIKFGTDTAAANALDDYEEGTWTMGISFGGGSTGVTYSDRTGTYTKIGRQVTVNGYLYINNKGTSTGAAFLTGLPFAQTGNAQNFSAASAYLVNISFANQFMLVGLSGTSLAFYETTESGATTGLTDADFANGAEVLISYTYFI